MDRFVIDQSPRLSEAVTDVQRKRFKFGINRNSRGFWLSVCLLIGAVAGWLMFYFGILQ